MTKKLSKSVIMKSKAYLLGMEQGIRLAREQMIEYLNKKMKNTKRK